MAVCAHKGPFTVVNIYLFVQSVLGGVQGEGDQGLHTNIFVGSIRNVTVMQRHVLNCYGTAIVLNHVTGRSAVIQSDDLVCHNFVEIIINITPWSYWAQSLNIIIEGKCL